MPPPRNALTVPVDRSSKRNETNNERIFFGRVLLVLDERGGRTQEAVGLQKKKKKKRIFKRQTQKSFVGYAKFRVLEHLHRLAEKKKLPRVKVMCERNVRVRVCVCVLLRRVNKIVHLNGFA